MRERETWVIIGYCENGPVSQITVWIQDFPLTNMSASHSAPRYRAPSAFGARVRQMPAAATTTATCSRSTVTGRPSATCPAGSGTISRHLIFFFLPTHVLSPTAPHNRRVAAVICSASHTCLLHADWCLQPDAMPGLSFIHLSGSARSVTGRSASRCVSRAHAGRSRCAP